MADVLETREVLADAYGRRHTFRGKPKRMLSHAVEVAGNSDPERGRVLRVLCKRVTVDNLADRFAGDPTASPTCPVCLREWMKRKR